MKSIKLILTFTVLWIFHSFYTQINFNRNIILSNTPASNYDGTDSFFCSLSYGDLIREDGNIGLTTNSIPGIPVAYNNSKSKRIVF